MLLLDVQPWFFMPTVENLQLDFNNIGEMLATENSLKAFDNLVNLKVLNLSANDKNNLLPAFLRYQEKKLRY